jgi:hypothetical protein
VHALMDRLAGSQSMMTSLAEATSVDLPELRRDWSVGHIPASINPKLKLIYRLPCSYDIAALHNALSKGGFACFI